MPFLPLNFGQLPPEGCDYAASRFAVLPVPFERSTSYGKGTANGPAAIVRASQSMELWDEELGGEVAELGIATLPPFLPESFDMGEALEEIRVEARGHLRADKRLIVLGGEHSLTLAPVRAAADVHGAIGVVQFDAHADLRAEYEGTPFSHASVMRRIVEDGIPTLGVGIRSLSLPEAELVRARGLEMVWGHELAAFGPEALAARLERLPERVYLTFDIDFFDPALVPATGTPEPGGGHWYPTLALLRELFRRKRVVAMDLVELAPFGPLPASDFLAAKLVYKCLGYWAEGERLRG
ncbi:MAG: agmatinase [Thermoanaerobaculia bacterium]|nr:agmatinase [Thermoanaerobaculia bacterium]